MIVLTGGAGLIGSVFLGYLNAQGQRDVLVVDNLASTDKWKNLRGKEFIDYVHKNDFLEQLSTKRSGKAKISAIVHLGACSATTERDADYLFRNNVHYTSTLAEHAVKNNIRFIYASSAATYGNGDQGFDDDPRLQKTLLPLNGYGYSKQVFDEMAVRSGLVKKIVGLKFFNVYGPNEYHKGQMQSVVFKAFHQAKEDGKIKLFRSGRKEYANGENLRDFIYVKDCAKVLYWLLTVPYKEMPKGIYNLGTGRARTWNDLAKSVFAALNMKPSIEYIDIPQQLAAQYQYFTEAKMERLRKAGYQTPFTSLEDGVADYIKNHLDNGKPYA